jgi:Alpha/beta hydrolase of unknown function (DUF900)
MINLKTMSKTILLVLLSLTVQVAFSADDIDKKIALYTKEKMTPIEIDQMDSVLERFQKESPTKNIIFFLHGRARHVEEEWKTLPTLEKNYNAKVVMFRWPAWSSLITRPVDRARESADEFAQALKGIKTYKEAHPEIFTNKKITLLVHSMGHVVMREFVDMYNAHEFNPANGTKLFDNYLSVAPDIGMNDHATWVGRIDFAQRKFITMNNKDIVLILSYILDLKDRNPYLFKLGLGFDTIPVKRDRIQKVLDPDTTYIDLSKHLRSDHRYFESTKPFLLKFFNPLMNGKAFVPESLGVKVKLEQGVYYVKN